MPRQARQALSALLIALLGLAYIPAQAADATQITGLGISAQDDFVEVDVAFKVMAEATAPDRIEVNFQVLKGYYLYRSKMKFAVAEGLPAGLGAADLPAGETKEDEYFGKQEVYHHDVVARLPVSRASKEAITLPVKVTYQGCADAGLCYAPQTRTFDVAMPAATAVSALAASTAKAGGYVSEQDRLADLIVRGNPLVMAGIFFLAGLALAFTPCVLPMVPIVAGLITAGGASVTRTRAFMLSLAYVLGMAATYTAAGVAVAAAGQQAQTLFQQTWIILLFAALFVAMAASMFGFFTVQMPSFIQTRLSQMSNQQRSGNYVGVVVMGALSALIVTTCVGPALVAALTVIGQSGQMLRGGFALFSMAIGMGVPLLVVGASAGQLLPRAGVWMDTVKQVFGALMLAVAVWMIGRVVPEKYALLLWMVPLISLALVLEMAQLKTPAGRGVARVLAMSAVVYAVLLGVGFTQGSTDPLQPLQAKAEAHDALPFQRIKSLQDLNAQVAAANAAGKTVMLDFYADWCVSCKEMEKYTFPKAEVRSALANTVWLQADVTANDDVDKTLQKHFGVVGPPSIIFIGKDGTERRQYRQAGYKKAPEFASIVTLALQ